MITDNNRGRTADTIRVLIYNSRPLSNPPPFKYVQLGAKTAVSVPPLPAAASYVYEPLPWLRPLGVRLRAGAGALRFDLRLDRRCDRRSCVPWLPARRALLAPAEDEDEAEDVPETTGAAGRSDANGTSSSSVSDEKVGARPRPAAAGPAGRPLDRPLVAAELLLVPNIESDEVWRAPPSRDEADAALVSVLVRGSLRGEGLPRGSFCAFFPRWSVDDALPFFPLPFFAFPRFLPRLASAVGVPPWLPSFELEKKPDEEADEADDDVVTTHLARPLPLSLVVSSPPPPPLDDDVMEVDDDERARGEGMPLTLRIQAPTSVSVSSSASATKSNSRRSRGRGRASGSLVRHALIKS